MAELGVNDGTGIVQEVTIPTIVPDPAPGADEKKPETQDAPAAEADDENSEKTEETPEQQAERRESRRSRARAREAAKLATAETEARMLREQLAREQARQSPKAEAPEPKREDFGTLEEFIEARADYRATQATRRVIEDDRKSRQEQETQTRSVETDKRIAKEWGDRETEFRKQAKDYDAIVSAFVESDLIDLDPSARRAILESDKGPAILYHLGHDEGAEAERIAKLSPVRQVIEIGKLEDKVSPAKRTSNAPPPVSAVKGRSATQGYSENMSDSEYKAWRKSHGARWAN